MKRVVGKPIAFASTGERLADFDQFHPDRMASRILGMGDVLTLIEQAEREFDREVTEQSAAKLLEGRFSLEDFLSQLQQVKKLGPLGGLLSLMPGIGKELKQASAQIDDGEVAKVEAVIRSMTPAERATPSLIDGSRRSRIARGSGTSTQDVNQLLKQFSEAQKLMRSPGMLKSMLGGGGPAFDPGALGELGDDDLMGALGSGGTGIGPFGSRAGGLGGGLDAPEGTEVSRSAAGGGSKPGASKGSRNKKKKGGRVTPKSSGSSRHR